MWTIIAGVLVVLLTCYYYLKDYDYFEKRGIPYSKPTPFLGSMWRTLLMRMTFAEAVRKMYNENREAKYLGFFEFMTPVVMIRDLELIRAVTIKNFEAFPDHRSFADDEIDPMFSRNLFNLRGDRWKDVRTTLSPAFTSSKMKAMFVLMKECAKRYGENLASLPADKNTIELKDAFTRYTNDVIATCAFGINVDSMTDRTNKFYVYGRESTSFGRWQSFKFFLIRCFPKLCSTLNIKIVKTEIADFFKELVAETIKTRDEKGIVRPDMIQLMMETRGKLGPGKELTIEDMTAQAFIFFFGGFESTSTLMCFAAYEVGVNDEVQKRLQDEIDEVLNNANGDVTYEAINNMKYLDAIINEALRMYPVVVGTDRICAKNYELPPALPGAKPHVVQKGQYVWIPIYGVQHDPEYFPEPEKFNPERFYDDPKQILNSGSFLSFGLGPRMCIGNRFALLEAKTLLFYIFANCTLKPCSKTVIPMKLSKKGFAMTAEGGFWFTIEQRKKAERVYVNTGSSAQRV
nr:PREDICTED: cytochrome P450 9e2-like [Megachile rotundata]